MAKSVKNDMKGSIKYIWLKSYASENYHSMRFKCLIHNMLNKSRYTPLTLCKLCFTKRLAGA